MDPIDSKPIQKVLNILQINFESAFVHICIQVHDNVFFNHYLHYFFETKCVTDSGAHQFP